MKLQTELVFISSRFMGHLRPMLQMARLLTRRHPRLSVTVFIIHFPMESLDGMISHYSSDSLRLVALPPVDVSSAGGFIFSELVKANTPPVRAAVRDILTRSDDSVRLAGFVVDVVFGDMTDLVDEFGLPFYIYFPTSAAYPRFLLHVQFLHDHRGLKVGEFKYSDAELEVPSYAYSVPGKVFPRWLFDDEKDGWLEGVLDQARRYRLVKGIIVTSFAELEPLAVRSYSDSTLPPVYPVGPLIFDDGTRSGEDDDQAIIMRWLDEQPPSSVVFLCFGSMGAFGEGQVREIARGVEQSGYRFLWCLRLKQPQKGETGFPRGYTNEELEQVLPEGFLHRTALTGRVIGWAPQVAVLARLAVGGFVSHCGWNSVMESIRYGVPIAAWPLFAEQQLNAFQMVKDFGLAVEIKMDYHMDSDCIVSADEIEDGLKKLMNNDVIRKKAKEMQEISRRAVIDDGSSHLALGRFIEEVMANAPFNKVIVHHKDSDP